MRHRAVILLLMFTLAPLVAQKTDYQYALIEAVKQKNLGNIPGAMELYRMVIEANDSVAVAYYELGTLSSLMGRNEEAVSYLGRAVSLDPVNRWYFDSYVDVLIAAKAFKKAKNALKEWDGPSVSEVDLKFTEANILFLEGKYSKAIRRLSSIERTYGISDKVTLLKANIYEKRGRYEKALAEIDRIIKLFPESIELNVVAAELAVQDNDRDKARDYYQKVFDIDSTNIYAITNLTDYYRKKQNHNKSFYFLEHSFRSKEIAYEKKMAIVSFYLTDPYYFNNYQKELERLLVTIRDHHYGRREIHLFCTDFYVQTREFEKAIENLEPLLTPAEKSYDLWSQGILLANAAGNSEKTMDLSTTALNLFPDSLEIRFFKGVAAYELEMYDTLLTTYAPIELEALPDSSLKEQVATLQAEAYYRTDQWYKADSLFRMVLRINPTNTLVMNNIAYYLAERGERLDEAEELSRQTIESEPFNATFLDTYAWVLFKLGRLEEAEQYILKALSGSGERDPEVNFHAAEIYFSMGQMETARSYYQRALKLGADDVLIIQRMEETWE